MDRHEIWRNVAYDYGELERRAPEGYGPVVLVFVAGRAEPLEVGFVRTRRSPEYPWVRFEISKGTKADTPEGGTVPASAFWVHAYEADVRRVEIHLREAPPFDFFNYEVLEDDPDTNSE